MGTFGQSNKIKNKERRKSIARAREADLKLEKSREARDEIEKLEIEIATTKSRIKNTTFDLNLFPDNKMIKNKIELLKKDLSSKEDKLEELKNGK